MNSSFEAVKARHRLAWGMGVFNHHILGSVALACAQGYELPPIIADIAADQSEEMWDREQHTGSAQDFSKEVIGAVRDEVGVNHCS